MSDSLPGDYKKFYDSSSIAFWRTAIQDGQFLMANEACAKLLGYDGVEELLNAKTIQMYTNGEREKLLSQLLSSHTVKNYHLELITKSGKKIWVVVTATAFLDKGYVEGSLEDVSMAMNAMSMETEKLSEMKRDIIKKIEQISEPVLNTASTKS